mmetsp:Transcript_38589/g.49234  ORF Transcript_38589/g.49234 Transcript_38589/m.49234 type:complete len:266 (-) Transcript_38589:138-935(-)
MINCYTPTFVSESSGLFVEETEKKSEKRNDGRSRNQLRRIFMDIGILSQSSGSAYVEFDRTKVICSINGPHVISGSETTFSEEGQLRCDFRYAPFARRERREPERRMAEDEVEMSQLLRQALAGSIQMHKLPKSVIDVYCVVLQDDGGELGAAITAGSLALANAGIELYDLVAACSVGCPPQGSKRLLLDPTLCERQAQQGFGVMTVAILPANQEVTQWWQEGQIEQSKIGEAVELCRDGCANLHKMMRNSLISVARTIDVHTCH